MKASKSVSSCSVDSITSFLLWWELAETIRRLVAIRADNLALRDGSYEELSVSNTALAFHRKLGTDEVIVAANLDGIAMSMFPGCWTTGRGQMNSKTSIHAFLQLI